MLLNEFTVFDDYNPSNGQPYGVTGMTIDTYRDRLACSKYHYDVESKIVMKDKNNTYITEIVVPVDHIQGIAYNANNDSFFVWHNYFDHKIMEINYSGNILRQFDTYTMPILKDIRSPGMLNYHPVSDILYFKGNSNAFIYGLDLGFMMVCETFDTKIGGEGFFIDDDVIYLHNGISLYKLKTESCAILETIPSPVYNQQSEGLVLDRVHNSIWISADEYLHGEIPGGNRIWEIQF